MDLFLWYSCFQNWSSSYLQYKINVLYPFFKRRTRKFIFRSYVLNLVKINLSFFFQRLVVPGLIYRLAVPSMYYQFGRFIGHACHNSRIKWVDLLAQRCQLNQILEPIYWQTAAKGLIKMALEINKIFNMPDINSTHKDIAYAHLTCTSHPLTMHAMSGMLRESAKIIDATCARTCQVLTTPQVE